LSSPTDGKERHIGRVTVMLSRSGNLAPDEVASMIAYLASDEAAFVTGQAIGADGGW
jgi:NAD(P)-dependent dehydrogenase (short-subunit alcohol dehydrogenase family)